MERFVYTVRGPDGKEYGQGGWYNSSKGRPFVRKNAATALRNDMNRTKDGTGGHWVVTYKLVEVVQA